MNLHKLGGHIFTLNSTLNKASTEEGNHNRITRGLTWALVFFAAVQALAILSPIFTKQSDSFNYAEKCGGYRSEIEQYLSKNFNDNSRYAGLERIFYSQKRASCLYSYTIETSVAGKPIYIHNLEDYFTGEKLESERADLENDLQVTLEFREKIKQYE